MQCYFCVPIKSFKLLMISIFFFLLSIEMNIIKNKFEANDRSQSPVETNLLLSNTIAKLVMLMM